MTTLADIAERRPLSRILAFGGLAAAVPVVLTVPAQGMADVVLLGIAGLIAVGTAAVARARWSLDQLPLELSPHAVRAESSGVVTIKVRARLGRGRVVKAPRYTARWEAADQQHDLEVHVPAQVLCGPFTLLAIDREGVTTRDGVLHARVEVDAGGRTWVAEGAWSSDQLSAGTFSPGVVRRAGRIRFDHDHWAEVVSEEAGLAPLDR